FMVQDQRDGKWEITDRDEHGQQFPPVVQIANRQRTHNRYGVSEITPEVRSMTDACVRTMLGMEVAREFYSTPQRDLLGATQEMFQDAGGSALTAWETYMGSVWAIERDEEGNTADSVGQFTPYDPSVYTKIIDQYSQIMGSLL